MFKRSLGTVAVILLISLAAACGAAQATPTSKPAATVQTAVTPSPVPATPTPAPTKGGTLRLAVRCDTPAIDPHGPSVSCMFPAWITYNTLVGFDSNTRAVPELAESWEVAKDGKAITFKLRKGVKFHDGSDFNAAAVKFNMERLNQPTARFRNTLDDVENVEVVDDYTVKFNLKRASAPLLLDLASEGGMIVSPDAVKKFDKDFPRNPVGTGPFKMGEWIKDSRYNMDRFEGYWEKDKPYLDRFTFNIFPDATVRLTNLRAGTVDFADEVPPKDVAAVKSSSNLKMYETVGLGAWRITFNTEKPPFDNIALRQAVSSAIDPEAIVKNLFYGTTQVASGPISPASWAFDSSIQKMKRDLAKAKAKLAEAGKTEGFEFTFNTYATEDYAGPSEAIQAQLAEAGIKAQLNAMASAQAISALVQGNYQAALSQYTGYLDPHGSTYLEHHSKAGSNRSRYKNPKFDTIVEEARASFEEAQRKKLYTQATQILLDEVPQAILFYAPVLVGTNNKVQNYVNLPGWYFKFRAVRDIWMTK